MKEKSIVVNIPTIEEERPRDIKKLLDAALKHVDKIDTAILITETVDGEINIHYASDGAKGNVKTVVQLVGILEYAKNLYLKD